MSFALQPSKKTGFSGANLISKRSIRLGKVGNGWKL